MILLVDAGNSRIKWGRLQHGKLIDSAASAYDGQGPDLPRIWAGVPAPEQVVAATVVAELETELRDWITASWGCPVVFARPQREGYGVRNGYREPQRLGVDRWLALVAARRTAGAACVYDCGTALTVDVLGADGAHQGGWIIPGYRMMRSGLQRGTRGIGTLDDAAAPQPQDCFIPGQDTAAGVAAGTLAATVAVIERIAREMERRHGNTIRHLLCGGDAPRVLPCLGAGFVHEPDLVLKGLAATLQPDGPVSA